MGIVVDKILGDVLMHDHWKSSVPSSPTDTGQAGDMAYDSSYFYVASGTNTWKRVAWSAWVVANEYLLMETGDFLLTEDGDKFILE